MSGHFHFQYLWSRGWQCQVLGLVKNRRLESSGRDKTMDIRQAVDTLRPQRNDEQFVDDIFKRLFLKKNVYQFWLKYTEIYFNGSS